MEHSEAAKSPTRWRTKKLSSSHQDFSLCLSKLAKFCKLQNPGSFCETKSSGSPSRRLRSLRSLRKHRNQSLVLNLSQSQDLREEATKPSDEQDTSSSPPLLLSWTAIDFQIVKIGRSLCSQIVLQSLADYPLIVKLSLDSRKEHYQAEEIRPLILSQKHVTEEAKYQILKQSVKNSHFYEKNWKLKDPKTRLRQNTVSVFLRPRETATVPVMLTVPKKSDMGSLKATMVDIITMGGKNLNYQRVFVFGRIENFPIRFSHSIYSEEHKTKLVPIVVKYSTQSQIINRFKLTLENTNIFEEVDLKLFPLSGQHTNSSDSLVDLRVTPDLLSIPPGCCADVKLCLRAKNGGGRKKLLMAVVGVCSGTSVVYSLYLQIEMIPTQ